MPPVRALVDGKAANEATLRNLLNAEGYDSLEDVRAEGHAEGQAEGEHQAQVRAIEVVLKTRGLHADEPQLARLRACRDPALLARWLVQAVTATNVAAALD